MSNTDSESNTPETSEASTSGSWDWREHIPLILAGFSIFFIGVRLLAISHGDFETADGILQTSGTATIIIGALEPIFGFIAIPVGVWIIDMIIHGQVSKSFKPFAIAAAAVLSLTGFFIGPMFIILLFGGMRVIFWLLGPFIGRIGRKVTNHMAPESAARLSSILDSERFPFYYLLEVATVILIIVMLNPVPWLPAEVVITANRPPLIGYVVGESNTYTTILGADNSQIVHIDSSKIISRTICRQQGVDYRGILVITLPNLLNKANEPHYPSCQGIVIKSKANLNRSSRN